MKAIKKTKFKINIWDYLDMEQINEELDKQTEKEGKDFGIATDISYKCLKITKDGKLILEANYREGIDWWER